MNDVTITFKKAMEQAGMLGLCHEGQLEMAVGTVRREYPDLSNEAISDLIEVESET
jgi:hypothetical protein